MGIVTLDPQVRKKLEAELRAVIPTPDERAFEAFAEELRRARPDLHRDLVLGLKVVPKMPAEQAAERAARRMKLRGAFERLFFQTRWPDVRVLDKRRVVLAGLLALMVALPSAYLLGGDRSTTRGVERLEPEVVSLQVQVPAGFGVGVTAQEAEAAPPSDTLPLEFGTREPLLPPPTPPVLSAPSPPIPPFPVEALDSGRPPVPPVPSPLPAARPTNEAATTPPLMTPPPVLGVAASPLRPNPITVWRQPTALSSAARVSVFAGRGRGQTSSLTMTASTVPDMPSMTASAPRPEAISTAVHSRAQEPTRLSLFMRQQPPSPPSSEVAGASREAALPSAAPQPVSSDGWAPGTRFPATLAVGLAVAEGGTSPVIAETAMRGCDAAPCPTVLWLGTARLAATSRVEMTFTQAVVDGIPKTVTAFAADGDGGVGVPSAPQDVAASVAQSVLQHAATGVADYARALADRQRVTIRENSVLRERDVPGLETFMLGSLANLLATPRAQDETRIATLAPGTPFTVLYGVGAR